VLMGAALTAVQYLLLAIEDFYGAGHE
jgi:hypothetical protein